MVLEAGRGPEERRRKEINGALRVAHSLRICSRRSLRSCWSATIGSLYVSCSFVPVVTRDVGLPRQASIAGLMSSRATSFARYLMTISGRESSACR
jgi:hypothetical protein